MNKQSLGALFAAIGAASLTAGCVVGHEGGEGGSRVIVDSRDFRIDTPGFSFRTRGADRDGGEGGEGGEGG